MQKMQKDDHSVPYMTQLPSRQILVNLESIQKNPAFTWGYQFKSNHPYQKKPVARFDIFAWSLNLPL